MLIKIRNVVSAKYEQVTSSIAFYPAVISIGLLLLAFILLRLEDNDLTELLLNKAPFLVINNADTARVILGTLIGGIISLTVFSFSMVMILLNQASSNFSPRLLPGLITDKKNQIVLGFYIGTIVYNIIILISILPSGESYTLNGFSILIGILLGISCLGLFVFFIHSISQNIQINVILESIYSKAKIRLNERIEMDSEKNTRLKGTDDWYDIINMKAGYFHGIRLTNVLRLAEQYETNIKVIPYKGKYILPYMPIFSTENKLSEEAQTNLSETIISSGSQEVSENFALGIKQITEVGVKAMSPGINDPGTAVITIDYLTELLALRMKLDDAETYTTENDKQTIEVTTINFSELIYHCLAAYRQYSKHDIILMEKLIRMVLYLINQSSADNPYVQILKEQLEIIKMDVESSIENKQDKMKLMALLQD